MGTAFSVGMLTAGLSKPGLTSLERYFLPLLGILHSAPILYPLMYARESFGFGSWLIAFAFIALPAFSLRSILQGIQDPFIGAPHWPERFRGRSGRGSVGSQPDRHT